MSIAPTPCNRASLQAAFGRLGYDDVPYTVVPGVASFGVMVDTIGPAGIGNLRRHILAGNKALLICAGFQLLYEGSEESPLAQGLGILPGICRKLPTPRYGWEKVGDLGTFYFAHQYGSDTYTYQHGKVWGCQFHPELSGPDGHNYLKAWLQS